jgi:AAA domain/Primase C terminal 2 (PriCT-2)
VCDDIRREDFCALQEALIEKLGTDAAIKDLPRVMRLPGTLHLKNRTNPQLVRLWVPIQPKRWKVAELVEKLDLQEIRPKATRTQHTQNSSGPFTPAEAERLRRKFRIEKSAVRSELAAGIDTNLEEIRSAVDAIPPSAISAETDWMKFARAMAREARIFPDQAEDLYEIVDTVSRRAPGYDEAENRKRWLRYKDEALDRDDPITIATVFNLAKKHGWTAWSPPTVEPDDQGASASVGQGASMSGFGSSSSIGAGLQVSFANIPHRRWLYGVDLIRGEITLLAAPGGVGKSSLAIGMAVAIATGKGSLQEKIWAEDLTTLYLNGEDSRTEMLRRIWAFCLKHGVAEQDLGRLLVAGADDWRTHRLSFLRTEKGSSLVDENGLAHLEAVLESLRPDLMVLDPLVTFCGGGNINDNAAMSLVMRAIKRLATKFDCAVLVVHHTRKGGDLSSAEAISGASAIVNLARRAIMTLPMSAEEEKKLGVLPSLRSRYFKVVASKSNLAPRLHDTPWYELCNTELPNSEPPTYISGDRVQAVARVHLPLPGAMPSDDLTIRRAILNVVERGKNIGGQSYPYSPNTTGAKNARAILDDAIVAVANATGQQWQGEDLRAITERSIKSLKSDGWLISKEIAGAGPFRRRQGLQIEWSKTPWAKEHETAAQAAEGLAGELEETTHHAGHLVNGVVND